jgi:hypothetical protein
MRGLIVDVHFAQHPQLTAAGPLGMLVYLAAAAYVAIHKVNFIPRLIADMLIPTESLDAARAPIDHCLAAGVLRPARRGGRDGLEVVELGIVDTHALTDGAARTARWRHRARSRLADPDGDPRDFHISTALHGVTGGDVTGVTPAAVPDPEQFQSVVQVQAATPAAETLTRHDWRRLCAVARREVQAHPELTDWTSRLDLVKTVCVKARLPGAQTAAVGRALEAVMRSRA